MSDYKFRPTGQGARYVQLRALAAWETYDNHIARGEAEHIREMLGELSATDLAVLAQARSKFTVSA